MNLYIVVTGDVSQIGGTEMLTYNKIKYYNELGWQTVVISSFYLDNETCKIQYLDKYLKFRSKAYYYTPADFTDDELEKIYRSLIKKIGSDTFDKVYIESHYGIAALWGEYLAKRLNGKHIFYTANESYRNPYDHYVDYMEFFWFKYKRNEIIGYDGAKKLFDGYYELPEFVKDKNIPDEAYMCVEGEPIDDIYDSDIETIKSKDYNITYIGRSSKGYVENVIYGVSQFAKAHESSSVNFLMVGDAAPVYDILHKALDCCKNVNIVLLGDKVPIPKSLYRKTDVVLAGSGSARYSYYEGKPVIVLNAENYLVNGIMGYTCGFYESVYNKPGTKQLSVYDALEDVLIKKNYICSSAYVPQKIDEKKLYDYQHTFFQNAAIQEYYPVENHEPVFNLDPLRNIAKTKDFSWIKSFADGKDSRIAIFGCGADAFNGYKIVSANRNNTYYFIDNDKNKVGHKLFGVNIFNPEIIKTDKALDAVFISSTKYWNEMMNQVVSMKCMAESRIIPIFVIRDIEFMNILRGTK